jgi:hypothetical protein
VEYTSHISYIHQQNLDQQIENWCIPLTSKIPDIRKFVEIEMLHSSLRTCSAVVEGGSSSFSAQLSGIHQSHFIYSSAESGSTNREKQSLARTIRYLYSVSAADDRTDLQEDSHLASAPILGCAHGMYFAHDLGLLPIPCERPHLSCAWTY